MYRPIAISLSPNTKFQDVLLALRTLLNPGKWFDQRQVEFLEKELALYFGADFEAFAVNSGRSALYVALQALGVGKGDEVLIQAFTCVALANPILWTGATPVYVDIGDSFNLDPMDLERKITKKTKAVVVQHTFGIPAEMDEILAIAKKHKLLVIEDCAHGLGGEYQGRKLGSLADLAFFSFGRDKVLSSVFGGMILCKDKALVKKIRKARDELDFPSRSWVAQQLFHPVAFSVILPFYNLLMGKVLLVLMQKLKLLSFPVYEEEKLGGQPKFFPTRMPGGLARLAREQFKKLNKFTSHRRKIAKFYRQSFFDSGLILAPDVKGASWLRFPIRVKMPDFLIEYAKVRGILLGNWYRGVVMPVYKLELVGYKKGSCVKAEKCAKEIVNLPTYPTLTMKQAEKVVKVVKQWLNSE